MTSPGRFRHIDGGVRRSWPRLKAGAETDPGWAKVNQASLRSSVLAFVIVHLPSAAVRATENGDVPDNLSTMLIPDF
jgi:hypothetical protein